MTYYLSILFVSLSVFLGLAQDRMDVPCSRLSIIPPEGGEIGEHFPIITKRNYFEMTIMEFASDVDPTLRDMDSAFWASKGVTVYDQFEIEVSGYKASCLHKSLSPSMDALTLSFGDSIFFVQIQTNYIKKHKNLYREILDSYNSLKFNKEKKIDWDAAFTFKYDSSNPFQLQKEYINPLLFTFLKESVDSLDSKTSFIAIRQSSNEWNDQSIESFVAEMISISMLPGYTIKEVIFDGAITHNGAQAYQFEAITQNDDLSEHLMKCLGHITEKYAVIVIANISDENDKLDADDFLKKLSFKKP